jgi:TonB family protein
MVDTRLPGRLNMRSMWWTRTIAWFVVVAGSVLANAQTPPRLDREQVRRNRGKLATVCGIVIAFGCDEKGETNLSFDPPTGRNRFAIVIPSDLRASFPKRLEDRFLGRDICVTGPIEKGRFSGDQIVAADPSAIAIQPGPTTQRNTFAPSAHRSCDPDVVRPKLLKRVNANYPTNAQSAGIQGIVVMQAVVEPDGTIGDIEALSSSHPDLERAAILALKQWRFEQGTYKGRPAPVIISHTTDFKLR